MKNPQWSRKIENGGKARNINIQAKRIRGEGIIMFQIVVQTVNIVLFVFEKLNTLRTFRFAGILSQNTIAI